MQDIKHAVAILSFYLAGSSVPGSCAARLNKALDLSTTAGNNEKIKALAKVLFQILVDLYEDPTNTLEGCAPDIPAVILSLAASTCVQSPWNNIPGLNPTTIPCTVSEGRVWCSFRDRQWRLQHMMMCLTCSRGVTWVVGCCSTAADVTHSGFHQEAEATLACVCWMCGTPAKHGVPSSHSNLTFFS
jgi:hypothetical protein